MKLQPLINSQADNGTLQLPPGEFFGQVTIDRPMTIVGRGKGTWIGSRTSPTIRIRSSGVKLQNLLVEITTGPDDVAIEALPGVNPSLEDVQVRGRVVGVSAGNIKKDTSRKDPGTTQIAFLPPPPMSGGAVQQQPCPPTSTTPAHLTTQPGSVAPGFRSKLPWLKLLAVGAAVLVVGLAVGGYFFQQRSREIAQLQEAARLTALEKQRIQREKREKQREIERLRALERERKKQQAQGQIQWRDNRCPPGKYFYQISQTENVCLSPKEAERQGYEKMDERCPPQYYYDEKYKRCTMPGDIPPEEEAAWRKEMERMNR